MPRDARAAAITSHDELAGHAAEGMLGPNPFVGLRPQDIASALWSVADEAWRQPRAIIAELVDLLSETVAILGGSSALAPAAGDRRFQDAAWRDNPLYRTGLQLYLAWARALGGLVDRLGIDPSDAERARFSVSLLIDALAPTNSVLSNPAALRKAIDTRGMSLLAGGQNLLHDLIGNDGMPAQVDKAAFQVGRTLGLSKGAVVLRTPVLELIQYAPQAATVCARPLLIVPPQINKFYLFDLAPGRSVIEFLAGNGLQVFAVSWRNPTTAEHGWTMDTYVAALLEAIDAVRDITGSSDVNLAGACSGAMTTAALLGHLAATGDRRVHAVTLMVMVLDRAEDSQLGLFATPETIAAAKAASRLKGVLTGAEMGRMFAWLRPNDLVWSYWVNNYLLGNAPPAVDLLYWNNDSTRLPARFHAQLLDLFVDDLFRRPGALTVLGAPIDLAKVTCDKYVVAGITDHITPWPAGYRAAKLFGGATDFVLSSSGHIQSILNPPGNPKAKFFVNPGSPDDPQAWLKGATTCAGSWWTHWREWLTARSGDLVPAPDHLGSDHFPPLADAPGTYVLEH
ncbi:MAG TPA: alpha/beta fold hydrolase [Alphaproteobacteria bacterium]|nr:alpha/beta fold hydrolase [Alphaproteobacteria bacterium]